MLCRCARALHATLLEVDRLLARHQFAEALALASRALERRLPAADLNVRFRIGRAHALWMCGRVATARAEAIRAMREANEPLTRARAEDALALFAWKEARFIEAQALVDAARRVYEACAAPNGLARSLQAEAGLLADGGRLEPALFAQTRRIDALRRATPERLGEARADRSTLLTLLGRWGEAESDIRVATDLFRGQGAPGVLALKSAALELSRGRSAASRHLLEQARAAERIRPSSPRVLADACLVASDIALAGGLAEEAEREADVAVRSFVELADRGGECRARVRRAQSLLALGRFQEAAWESERALKNGIAAGTGIGALAELTLGRALLRTRRAAALAVFERAERAAQLRPDLTQAARLGRALALSGDGSAEEIDEALAALEQWGDLRLLEFARAEVHTIRGVRAWVVSPVPVPPRRGGVVRGRREQALVDAALCLAKDDEEWPRRWARAMAAVRTIIPFDRVALLSKDAHDFELRAGFDDPAPLPSADVARDLACRAQGPALFAMRRPGDEGGRGELVVAMVAPVKQGAVLYAESTGVTGGSDDRLDLLADVARLVAAYLPDDEPPVEVEAPTIPGLIGRSEPMRALFVAVAQAAATDGTIHVFGETGTGKERVARAIHDLSRRASSPFVALNAASLGQELLESQLFGHVRGAFSGAVQDAMGLVAEAEGGTLFLDEVADLPLASQAKLLRFLQEGEYRRLGDTRLRKAKVRVLTAANIPLDDLVLAGRLRKDLRFRIGGVVLEAPPLRTRGNDVVLLARYYLEKLAARDKVPVPRLGQDAILALRAHSWPGNVRELQNEMERLVMVVRDRPARRDDLSPSLRSAATKPSARGLSEVRLAVERDHVSAALERHAGSRTRAAADLGITRQALHVKIRRLGLPTARPTPA